MKKYLALSILTCFLAATYFYFLTNDQKAIKTVSYGSTSIGAPKNTQGRHEWELQRLRDPSTGKLPSDIRRKELAFAKKYLNAVIGNDKAANWEAKGPYNVGGRTRALTLDIRDETTIWAGAVSGGIWRSIDAGANWEKITPSQQIQNVTTLVQDTRPGKEDTWYYGTGEALGNSPSAPGAFYLGNGVYKTTDNGATWSSLNATASDTPEDFDDLWDLVFRLAIDPANTSQDVVYAAALGTILRSADGGDTWANELGGSATSSTQVTDVLTTSSGVVYATLSSTCNNKGIWRSTDGENWTNITDVAFPSVYDRIVMGINPSNENEIYFLGTTPGGGQTSTNFLGEQEDNSLWKYTYISGDGSGSGGTWTNLSSSIPNNQTSNFDNFYAQGAYDLIVKVKPDDPNTVIIGGTNLYRSTDGFATGNNTTQIGGYLPGTTFPNFQIYPNHHPDNHELIFLPSDPDILISGCDGGVYRTNDVNAGTVNWTSLNNGYQSTQLYTVGFNPSTTDDILIGGFQDNGNFFTSSNDPQADWVLPLNGDGSFMGIANTGNIYYLSIQRGKIFKMELDNSGTVTAFRRIDPIGGENYNFINPFVLDPNDNNLMYVAGGRKVWRNNDLSNIAMTNQYDSITQGWSTYSDTVFSTNSTISAISVSTNPANVVYYGTSRGKIYKIENAHTGDPSHEEITKIGSIRLGAFPAGANVNSIAIDPSDADKVLVTFSNYNVYSLYYTEDGGTTWSQVAGNLESDTLGTGPGPSCRWASILPRDDGTLYLIGTSVGLYATDQMVDKNTIWKQVQTGRIGNVVVEMVQTRTTDGLIVAATHGNGIYATKTSSVDDVVGVLEQKRVKKPTLKVYPNPSQGLINLDIGEVLPEYDVVVRNMEGKEVFRQQVISSRTKKALQIDLSDKEPGVYFLSNGAKNAKVVIAR